MKKTFKQSLNIWKDFLKEQSSDQKKIFKNEISRKIYNDLTLKGFSKINVNELFLNKNQGSEELNKFYNIILNNFEKFYEEVYKKNLIDNSNSRKADYQYRAVGTKYYEKFESDFKSITNISIIKEVIDNFLGQNFFQFQSDYWITVKNRKNNLRQASQRWHSDPEFHKILKIFIYLDDVEFENGPTEYIPESFLAPSLKQFILRLYNFPHISSYYPEWLVNLLYFKKERFISKGRKGDIFFYNTTGLHRGGYVENGERKLTIFSFTNVNSPYLKESYI